ncbi:MAG: UDP-N-acetylmuramoyl-L-alanine--D-glutamate ligase [bacterium]
MSAPGPTLILGLGVSGVAAAQLAAALGDPVIGLDTGDSPGLRERTGTLAAAGVDVRLGWTAEQWPGSAPQQAVISPGIAPISLLGRLAAALPCPVISELEFGFRHCACPVLAISGTNGKTTTTELLEHCLRTAGQRVLAAGNIGVALCEAARRSHALDWLAVEVSSFQLESCDRFAPAAAALLNLTPDHLDRYGTMSHYAAAKGRLFRNLRRGDQAVLRCDLLDWPELRAALPRDGSRPRLFSGDDTDGADWFVRADGMLCRRRPDGGATPLVSRQELQLKGGHNLENVLAASALCELAGLSPAAIQPGLTSFQPSPHRLQWVGSDARGVTYINDSKATNPDALIRALAAVRGEITGKIVLIAGGLDKHMDFSTVPPHLARQARGVFLIGACKERLAKAWNPVIYCRECETLAVAVAAAAEMAQPGDAVLLSPACASMDMFVNYADRGNRFCELVKRRLLS